MKQLLLLFLLPALLLVQGAAAQTGQSFTIQKTGTGKQNVVLIPGFSCSGDVWKETVQTLSRDHTCYIVTFSGYAGTPAQSDPKLHTWVSDLAAYIREQHIDQPVVIGHSLGGGVAMWLAADYPDLIGKIVVVDALPCLAAMFDPAFKAEPQPDCSGMVKQFEGMSAAQFYAQQKAGMYRLLADTSRLETVVDWAVKSDRNTLALTFCQFMQTDLREKIAGIRCPALILLEPSFKAYPDAITQQFARLQQKEIKYAGKGLHFIMFDDKQWFLDNLKPFL